jgi:hypothetical protein
MGGLHKARASLVAVLGVMLAACGPGAVPDGQVTRPSAQETPTRSHESSAIGSASPSSCASCGDAIGSLRPTATSTPPAPGGSGTWTAAGALNDHRVGTQLARLGTGEVLAVGDDLLCGIENAETDTADLWASGAWGTAAPLPAQRNGITMVALARGDALVTGGANSDYVAKSSTVVFDDRTREWSRSGLLNTARMAFAAAALPDGRVLVAGGLFIDFSQHGRALGSAEIWDPETGTWAETDAMSSPRLGAVAVTLSDGRVLVAGGVPEWGGDVPLDSAEIFDPEARSWSPAGTLSGPRDRFSIVALPDGGALVLGGVLAGIGAAGETLYPSGVMSSVERFDPGTNTWSPTDDFDAAGRRPATAALADGQIFAVAGRNAAIYNPLSGVWTTISPIPDLRYDATAVLLEDGSVLVAGGWSTWVPDTPGCPTPIPGTWRFIPVTGSG